MELKEKNFEFNWDEDLPKILELAEVPEGFDKDAMVAMTISFLIGA